MIHRYDLGRGIHRIVNDRTMITVWIAMVLTCATLLILLAHSWLNPDVVFVGMICMLITPIVAHMSNMNNRLPPGGTA